MTETLIDPLLQAQHLEAIRIAGQECPLCGRPGRPCGKKNGYPLRECANRHGKILLSWQFAAEHDYLAQYSQDYHTHCQEEEGQRPTVARDTEHLTASLARLRHYELFVAGRTVLDIGCGAGAFVAAATAAGWSACGYDPCDPALQLGQRLGRNVHRGNWGAVNSLQDLITLHDVWEHLTRPVMALRHLAECLAPSGLIAVEIPDWGCAQARREGLNWKHVRPTQHLFLPDQDAAAALFRNAGLAVEATWAPVGGAVGKRTYLLTLTDPEG